jgi:hypothetical protein
MRATPIHDLDGREGFNLLGEPDKYATKRLRHLKAKGPKYLSPVGREMAPYLPVLNNGTKWRDCRNETVELFATEGPKKAITGVKFGLLTFGLLGVYGFLTKTDDDESAMIAQLRYLPIVKNQRIGIVFDQEREPTTARNVWIAAVRFAKLLRDYFGAKPFIVKLKCACGCKGLDDYLVKHGRKAFDKLARVTTFDDAIDWGHKASDVKRHNIDWLWRDASRADSSTPTTVSRASVSRTSGRRSPRSSRAVSRSRSTRDPSSVSPRTSSSSRARIRPRSYANASRRTVRTSNA